MCVNCEVRGNVFTDITSKANTFNAPSALALFGWMTRVRGFLASAIAASSARV